MIFALLGYGRFGHAFTDMLQLAGHDVRIHDPNADVPAAQAAASLQSAVQGADWIVLAMPVARFGDVLGELRPMLSAGQTVIDVGSVKQGPCALMDEHLGAEIPHTGTHPLFGPLSLARGDRPLRVVLCASTHHSDAAERARKLFESLDCEVIDRDPAEHDRAMAQTHAMAFFVAKALVEMGIGEDLSMAPPSFKGMANMLAAVRGDAGHLFSTIQHENPYAPEAREELIKHLSAIDQKLREHGDDDLAIPGTTPN
ncbi:MAG TPA: prephenate dehydrogenase [Oleiagrimonas sp.]|nr:prephenate dehydrogenase [Oleiagrimonas sp.]